MNKQEWISVKDKLPPRGVEVLIWLGWRDIGFHSESNFYVDNGVNQAFHVTHWMPLPEPPHDKDDK